MVRCASGVTRIRQRAVGGPSSRGGVRKSTPAARMSWREHLAQLIALDLADIGGAGAERGQRRHGVGAGAARHLDRRPDAAVQLGHARLVDQRHRALGQIEPLERSIVGLGQHVDDRVAEAEHVELGRIRGGHGHRAGPLRASWAARQHRGAERSGAQYVAGSLDLRFELGHLAAWREAAPCPYLGETACGRRLAQSPDPQHPAAVRPARSGASWCAASCWRWRPSRCWSPRSGSGSARSIRPASPGSTARSRCSARWVPWCWRGCCFRS